MVSLIATNDGRPEEFKREGKHQSDKVPQAEPTTRAIDMERGSRVVQSLVQLTHGRCERGQHKVLTVPSMWRHQPNAGMTAGVEGWGLLFPLLQFSPANTRLFLSVSDRGRRSRSV